MVEHTDREAIESGVDAERPQRRADRLEAQVAQPHMLALDARRLILGDELHAVRLDACEVVVERQRCTWRGIGGEPRADVVAKRPRARPAAGDNAGEHHRAPRRRRASDALRRDGRRRRHDELGRVLDRSRRVEQQDVLRPGTDVDGEDPHGHQCKQIMRRGSGAPVVRGHRTNSDLVKSPVCPD